MTGVTLLTDFHYPGDLFGIKLRFPFIRRLPRILPGRVETGSGVRRHGDAVADILFGL